MAVCGANHAEIEWIDADLIFELQANFQTVTDHRSSSDAAGCLTVFAAGQGLFKGAFFVSRAKSEGAF